MALFRKKYEPIVKVAEFQDARSGLKSEVSQSYIERIPFEKLEFMYHNEPVQFGGINLIQKGISDADFLFHSPDTRTQNLIDDILEETDFRIVILEKSPLHLGIAGNCFIEYIPDEHSKEILNIKTVDFKTMNFIREEGVFGKVALNDKGRIKGWIHSKSDGTKVEFYPDKFPMMEHLTINQLHEGTMGIGLIEPCYKDVEIKENLEKSMGELAYGQAFPIPACKYGIQGMTATAELANTAEKVAKDLSDPNTKFISHGYGLEPYFIQAKSQMPALETIMNILNTYISSTLGIPLALILQTGMFEQRATLEPLLGFYEITVRAIEKSLKADIMMKKILESRGIKKPKFTFNWSPVSTEALKERAMRLRRMAQAGLLEPDQNLKDYLRKMEKLPI